MKIKFLLILLLLPIFLLSEIIEIKQDGTGDFLTIQEGVDSSAINDTILVYPGRYIENVEIEEKSLTLASLYLFNPEDSLITQTIIDGNQSGSCIISRESENIIINGFTCTNGSGTQTAPYFPASYGGGIFLRESISSQVMNCIIEKNTANGGGGGIISYLGDTYLSNLIIRNNFASYYAGGLSSAYQSHITFDEENLCSIYNNYAAWGCDINITEQEDLRIVLDIFTIPAPQIDQHFISFVEFHPYYFSTENYLIEPVQQDLYVSAEGDDDNDGLTPETPLQTLSMASAKILPDSINIHTIHLANGLYSVSANNQKFPVNPRGYINIIGETEENVIFDGEDDWPLFRYQIREKKFLLKNITLTNAYEIFSGNAMRIYIDCQGALENVTIKNSNASSSAKAFGSQLAYLNLKNITVRDNRGDNCFCTMSYEFEAENITISGARAGGSCYGGAFSLTGAYGGPDNPITIKNFLVYDNTYHRSQYLGGVGAMGDKRYYITNATITDNAAFNSTTTVQFSVTSDATLNLYNSIVYSDMQNEICLRHEPGYTPPVLNVEHSLIRGGEDGIFYYPDGTLNWGEGNLDCDPLFDLDNEDEPFSLSSRSPCIDAGTTDLPDCLLRLPEFDIAGNPRIYGETIDMGAYEWNPFSGNGTPAIPEKTSRIYNYPNPFNPSTTICLELEERGKVLLQIFNVKGQLVKTLIDSKLSRGYHEMIWRGKDQNGNPVATGHYFLKLNQDGIVRAKKMLLMK